MVASRGPVSKRSEERIRTNAPDDGIEITKSAGAAVVEVPAPDEDWHAVAYDWYLSLDESGQSRFYEPSDWMTAYILAEQLSRLLNPRPTGMFGQDMKEIPMSGSDLSGLLKGMASLMVTEGDRRRMRLELTRAPDEGELPAGVVAIGSARSALGASQAATS